MNPSRKVLSPSRPSASKINLSVKCKAILILSACFLCACVSMFTTSAAQAPVGRAPFKTERYDNREVVAGEVLVKFSRAATRESLAQAKQDADIHSDEEVGGGDVRLFRSRSKNVAALLRELSARNDVAYVEPNYVLRSDALPNDPNFPQLYGLRNTAVPGADISAVPAWDITTGSRSNVVAVLDTGIDYNHPDLAANVWSAPSAFTVNIGGRSIRCEAGTHGFNAITKTCDPLDDHYHGTHVAGTIGATGNNSTGVVGVNWTASILGIKFLNSAGEGTTADAINGIEFAIQTKAAFAANAAANVRVLNNSYGGDGFSQAMLDAINKANANDMLFVASAGNSGSNNDVAPTYPASYKASNMVTVAATDSSDGLASFSNYGVNSVHLGAPGVSILSTTPNNGYAYLSGTSMAAPHVAGAAALILSRCSSNTAALKSLILNNTDLISSMNGKTVSNGRLNVNRALRSCSTTPPPPTPTVDTVWVEDAVPAGGVAVGDDGWNWISTNPAPYSGTSSHQSTISAGTHQHYFYGATQTLSVTSGETLFAYVYLDPANMPSEVMLQWNDGSWEHRAYWGADQISWGTNATQSRRYMGALPVVGQWVRLEVAASQVGLEGKIINGMAFTLFGGRASWDHAGKAASASSPVPTPTPSPTPIPTPGSEYVWVEDTIPTGGTPAGDSEGWSWVSTNPTPYSGTLTHQSNAVGGIHQHYFYNATDRLTINTGDTLFAYVYLDPANPPEEVMLQWNDGGWEHRAYWGANRIEWGINNTESRRYMGTLPSAGQWVRLEVPASQVGLEGKTLNGMAFTLFGGRATWDRAGRKAP